MTADKDPADAVISAADLRMQIVDQQLADLEKQRESRNKEAEELATFSREFLSNHVSEAERDKIRRLVDIAVKDGKFEALVYSFPSDLCTDGGRAINNADPSWPDTLRGKARELYDRYESVGKPAGFKLKAMIINFPGGIPGDVGFFLNWAPDQA